MKGSLAAVGSGIVVGQLTPQAQGHIKRADVVFCLVADAVTSYAVRQMNANVKTLSHLYAPGKERQKTYDEMAECIMAAVMSGQNVCAVAYGHPGVFAYPLHEAVRQARQAGIPAAMYPGISAEDNLFADLGVDPGQFGCQSFEATDFLVFGRKFDETSSLILWQIGAIAERSVQVQASAWNRHGLQVLTEVLIETYGARHLVVIYEAAQLPVDEPAISWVALEDLPNADVGILSTLYIPPGRRADLDTAMLTRLRLSSTG